MKLFDANENKGKDAFSFSFFFFFVTKKRYAVNSNPTLLLTISDV